MRRHLGGLALGFVLLAVAGPARGTSQVPATLLDRAFTVVAEAYPTEPAPGSQNEPVAIRPYSSRTNASNPPGTGYARAAQSDLGLAEGYLGPQGANAEADTSVVNQPREVTVDEGGAHLEVRVSDAPSAEASAQGSAGGPSGSARSRTSSGVVDGVLVATAHAEVQNFAIGPMLVGSGRFDAEVRVDGSPGGAAAEGRIVMNDVTVNGIPVVLDAGGVRVDTTEIPAPFVDEATAQMQQYFSEGGYSDVRVVQPRVTVADDGSSAEVAGGGVFMHFTNNDPANRYFVQYSLLGGRAFAAVGTEFDVVGPPIAPPADPPSQTPPPSPPATSRPGPVAAPSTATPGSEVAAETPLVLAYADGEGRAALRGIWPGWPWVVGAGAALVGAYAAAMRNDETRRRIDAFRNEYLRG